MTRPVRVAAVAAHFGRDVERCVAKAEGIVVEARSRGVDLLVLPHAVLGGYLGDLRSPGPADLPPALPEDAGPVRRIAEVARGLTVCFGYTEAVAGGRCSTALCVGDGRVLGRHRKVHLTAGEEGSYAAGGSFTAFDTPAGRLGMLIDFDKTFPESARTLALDGAQVLCCPSAWPASVTDRAARLANDRQSRLFDLYDGARAAENQVVLVSANQTGVLGGLRFLGQAKVVGPGGDVLARTGGKGGMAVVDVDVAAEVARARRTLHHLRERRPGAYRGLLDELGAASPGRAGAVR
ncbi:carbon-nitrogen hydrolase family protein [Kineococcus terrestris]|uniref:carbon-nitrogen hydrolase family protein n=1 Tax=Kineococcus terrestris TaxID=2044856 RepID=UPI0034DB759F